MINKKGFTLVEILVVIALIAVISIITIPSINLINKNINIRVYESKRDLFLIAAKKYGKEHDSLFVTDTTIVTVTLDTLLKENYIKADEEEQDDCIYTYGCIINPIDKTNINNLEIQIVKKNNLYIATWNS